MNGFKRLIFAIGFVVILAIFILIMFTFHPPTYENGFKDGYESLRPQFKNDYTRGFEEGIKKYQEEMRIK